MKDRRSEDAKTEISVKSTRSLSRLASCLSERDIFAREIQIGSDFIFYCFLYLYDIGMSCIIL